MAKNEWRKKDISKIREREINIMHLIQANKGQIKIKTVRTLN